MFQQTYTLLKSLEILISFNRVLEQKSLTLSGGILLHILLFAQILKIWEYRQRIAYQV